MGGLKKLEEDVSPITTQLKLDGYLDVPTAAIVGIPCGFFWEAIVELTCCSDMKKEAAEMEQKIKNTRDQMERHRLTKDLLDWKFSRLGRIYILGGVKGATFFATFYGVHNWLSHKRGVIDDYNTVTACATAVASLALFYKKFK